MNNKPVNSHKDLDAWIKSVRLVTDIYKVTKRFPKDELYGLAVQMRRAAVSIPSNIAEGASRNSRKEFMQFLYIALGSTSELETQIIISRNLSYIEDPQVETFLNRIDSLKKMLNGLIAYLKNRKNP